MLMFLIMRNGGGFHRSFPAAAVGYAIRFVFCSSTVAVLFYLYIQAVPAGYDLANKGAAIRDGLQPL